MKRSISLLILLSFVGVGVFGFIAMQSKHGGPEICLAEITNPAGCSENSSVYQGFSSAIIATLAILLAAIMAFALFMHEGGLSAIKALSASVETNPTSQKLSQIRWYILSEKRDPSSAL